MYIYNIVYIYLYTCTHLYIHGLHPFQLRRSHSRTAPVPSVGEHSFARPIGSSRSLGMEKMGRRLRRWSDFSKYMIYIYIWVWVNTYRYIFSGMNIHLPAILGFTRYQGFDPSPYTWHFTTSFALEFARNDYVDSRSSRLLMASPFRYSKQLAMVTMVDGDDPSMAGKLSL